MSDEINVIAVNVYGTTVVVAFERDGLVERLTISPKKIVENFLAVQEMNNEKDDPSWE